MIQGCFSKTCLKLGLLSMTSYKPLIYNTNVTYNYSNNSFNITWDAIDTSNFMIIIH